MSDDPCTVPGVAKDASQSQIRIVQRKLAKTPHPDLHPGKQSKAVELQAVATAHDIIGDAEKRQRFIVPCVLGKKEEREFGGYRTQRLVLAAWDQFATGELH